MTPSLPIARTKKAGGSGSLRGGEGKRLKREGKSPLSMSRSEPGHSGPRVSRTEIAPSVWPREATNSHYANLTRVVSLTGEFNWCALNGFRPPTTAREIAERGWQQAAPSKPSEARPDSSDAQDRGAVLKRD